MSKLKLVVFDFDGTLADSVELCLTVFDKVFAEFLGDQGPSREDIFREFGRNEPGILRCCLPERAAEAEQRFYQLHRELHPVMCRDLFPGCRAMLESLKEHNLPMAMVTGRSPETCRISLEYLKIRAYFSDVLTGAPDCSAKAPQLRELLERYHLNDDEMVYVGDGASDAVSSHEANVECLSAAWAKSTRIADLEKVNPSKLFFSPEALLDHLLKRI